MTRYHQQSWKLTYAQYLFPAESTASCPNQTKQCTLTSIIMNDLWICSSAKIYNQIIAVITNESTE